MSRGAIFATPCILHFPGAQIFPRSSGAVSRPWNWNYRKLEAKVQDPTLAASGVLSRRLPFYPSIAVIGLSIGTTSKLGLGSLEFSVAVIADSVVVAPGASDTGVLLLRRY